MKSYGEFEFWFASIKVAAIIAFIAIAAGWLLGIGGGDSPGLSQPHRARRLLPRRAP